MRIGYARVSTRDQILTLQKDALAPVGCGRAFTDAPSGDSLVESGLLGRSSNRSGARGPLAQAIDCPERGSAVSDGLPLQSRENDGLAAALHANLAGEGTRSRIVQRAEAF